MTDVPDDRSGFRPQLGGEPVRVGLLNHVAVMPALDLVLVHFARAEIRDEQLPHARRATVAHGMAASVPMVEVAHHTDPLGVGRPDSEMNPAKSVMRLEVGSQPLIVAVVRSFTQEMQIKVRQERAEKIRVDEVPSMPFVVLNADPIGKCIGTAREPRAKNPSG